MLLPFPPPGPAATPPEPRGTHFWQRFGSSPEDAAYRLAHYNLTASEKAQLVMGYGWHGYTLRHGHYTGNIRGIPRLGIPPITLQDAGQGFRTADSRVTGTVTSFPSSLAAAATWDRTLVHRYAFAIGEEVHDGASNSRPSHGAVSAHCRGILVAQLTSNV